VADAPTVLDVMDRVGGFGDRSWSAWRTILAAIFGLPLDAEQLAVFRELTGRQSSQLEPVREAWIVAGRRAGKSRIAALVAVFLAVFRDYSAVLAPGERGTVMVIAADRRQARTVFRYLVGIIEREPSLKGLVGRRTQDALDLKNGVTIEIHVSSYRSVRGYTIVGAVLEELAFWRDETSANPDVEVINALRPAMATVAGALLLAISSPYWRRGALWSAYKENFGRDLARALVVQAPTLALNPTVDPSIIGAAYETDEVAAAAEYGGQFRRDIESYVSREAVEAVVVPERRELVPAAGIEYHAFTDAAGGSGDDSYTVAVAHAEERDGRVIAVLDSIRERRPPFSPSEVTREFAELLHLYRVTGVVGDHYAGSWPAEQFAKHGIEYETCPEPKSAIYRDGLPMLNSGAMELLDQPRLIAQLCGLERRTGRGGKDSIDHGPHAHDDVANCVIGALLMAADAGAYSEPARVW